MSNETFLISIKQNNQLSGYAVQELRMDCSEHPLNQRKYIELAALHGNAAKYGVVQTDTYISPLLNKKILFLGSSVTLGYGALAESFVDYLWKRDGALVIKDAENGTTLTDDDEYSYVKRFQENLKNDPEGPDVFVLQLSTNDATQSKPLGKIANDGKYDLQTITGALEYIVSAAKEKWNCPILIFTNPDFNNPLYEQMVDRAQEVAEKYGAEMLDFFHDPNFKNLDSLYMADPIHPTRAGYKELWLPKFDAKLSEMVAEK